MLETVAIPLLLQAVEFLFGEGSKLLEERRERRNMEQEEKDKSIDIDSASTCSTKSTDVIRSKEAVLSEPVDQKAWAESEANIEHLMSLLKIYTKNYRLAKEQYAKWGSALVPPIIVNNLVESENEIEKTTKELQTILCKIYDKEIIAPEVGRI